MTCRHFKCCPTSTFLSSWVSRRESKACWNTKMGCRCYAEQSAIAMELWRLKDAELTFGVKLWPSPCQLQTEARIEGRQQVGPPHPPRIGCAASALSSTNLQTLLAKCVAAPKNDGNMSKVFVIKLTSLSCHILL